MGVNVVGLVGITLASGRLPLDFIPQHQHPSMSRAASRLYAADRHFIEAGDVLWEWHAKPSQKSRTIARFPPSKKIQI